MTTDNKKVSDKDTNIMPDNAESGILDELDELDKAIIRFKIEGHKNEWIAERTEKNRNTISRRLKKVKVQQAIEELQKKALQILLDTQSDAARELRRIVKHGTDENKIKAAKEILKGVLTEKTKLDLTSGGNELPVQIVINPVSTK